MYIVHVFEDYFETGNIGLSMDQNILLLTLIRMDQIFTGIAYWK